MAKISLRMYNREIESLVEQSQRLDEAIAHCRHILQTFPKHLETYRLLGKAYLEAKRYDQAVDIFQRVLVAAPDDFVSHVGMSIIADDKGRLDDAIWHMERAFEVQPSNAAIQGELQRLFGRRDGVEPPKIRLTRGALAHMYVQGELYNQAISEIRAVLNGDPKRTDMQTLLARAYYRNGQKAEAADICADLLGKYPYCLDANRLMVEIAPATQRADAAQEYRQRVIELDPYAAFATDSVFRADNVADNLVTIERLEYSGQTAEMPPSLGIGLETDNTLQARAYGSTPTPPAGAAAVGLPAWLSGAADEPAPRIPETPAPDKNDLPDFLRQAGWDTSSGAAGQAASAFAEQPEAEPGIGGAVEGDLPAWVKALAPSEAETTPTAPIPPAENIDIFRAETGADDLPSSSDMPDWLSGLGDTQAQEPAAARPGTPVPPVAETTLPADAPDWFRELGPASSTSTTPAEPTAPKPEGPVPPVANTALPADTPDWLRELGPASPASTTSAEPIAPKPEGALPPVASTALPADTPDWLRELGPASSASMTPAEPSAPKPEGPVPPVASTALPVDKPDWLRELGPASSASTPSAEPADDTPGWLKDLGGGELDQPLAPAVNESETNWIGELQSSATSAPTAEPQDESPDWLKDFGNDLETPMIKPAQPEPKAPAPSAPATPTSLGSLGTSSQEQDDAMAWLEGLAAKHGAKPEELVTDPNARTEVAPDWVDKAKEIGEQPLQPAQPTATDDETGMWLRNLAAEEDKPQAPQAPARPAEEQPFDFRSGFADQTDFGSSEAGAVADEQPIMGAAETSDWLKSVESKPAEPQGLEDVPEWLRSGAGRGVDQASPLAAPRAEMPLAPAARTPEPITPPVVPQPPDEAGDQLPAWLSGLEQDETAGISQAGGSGSFDDLPSWLKSDAEPEPAAMQPANPADWRPIQAEQPPEQAAPLPVFEAKPEPAPSPTPIPAPPAAPSREPEPAPMTAQPMQTQQPAPMPAQPVQQQQPAPTPAPVPAPAVARPKPVSPPVKAAVVSLGDAQSQLGRGNIAAALDIYTKLIRKGKSLEDIIRDLRDALYRYPVEVPLWQSLGDAYMRANRLQEALDAYTKAEELLR